MNVEPCGFRALHTETDKREKGGDKLSDLRAAINSRDSIK